MSVVRIFIKRDSDAEYQLATLLPIEFPLSSNTIDKIIIKKNSSYYPHNQFIFICDFNKDIDKKIESADDILHITLTKKEVTDNKKEVLDDSSKHWKNMLMKRNEDIIELQKDRDKMIKKLDNNECNEGENGLDGNFDNLYDDVKILTETIKNHNKEINEIKTTNYNIDYNEKIQMKLIKMECGKIKRIKLHNELYDMYWCIQNYANDMVGESEAVIEVLSDKTVTLNIPKFKEDVVNLATLNVNTGNVGIINSITIGNNTISHNNVRFGDPYRDERYGYYENVVGYNSYSNSNNVPARGRYY